jgi:hypothetical protein
MHCLFCDVTCIVVCTFVLNKCHRVATQLQLNITYHTTKLLILLQAVCTKTIVHLSFEARASAVR